MTASRGSDIIGINPDDEPADAKPIPFQQLTTQVQVFSRPSKSQF
jgi:hypothetical protein